jgi:GT2 family glycosyltransferase
MTTALQKRTSKVQPGSGERLVVNRVDEDIAIVILNWNQYEDTAECLTSLRRVHHPAFRTVMVDNGSTDGSPEKLQKEFPELNVIRNQENLGYVGGNNLGISFALETEAQYILLLNNDTVVDSEFLSELLDVAHSNCDAGIIGARVVYHDRPDVLWALGGNLQQPFGRIKMLGRDKSSRITKWDKKDFDHVPGAVMLVRAAVFRQVGALDPDFFLNWEDAEFCLRAKKGGWRVIVAPGSLVRHKVSKATAGRLATYFGQRNRLLFARKILPRWQFLCVLVPYHWLRLAALVVSNAVQFRFDLVKAAILGTMDFFRGRLGKGSMARVQRF